ncbi:insulinase family protein [Marinobacter persicus]|uniref:Protease 3 n=1 Tax=Marinobacter persicus TaxID=930118 RepID=A0A2S6G6X1_9GAMM|nr:insulinase family protein [Marinobacter persicus]PPK51684.1 secreted Zn-dependent insulinase-like peptidase [Marinobacter persicus]PPK54904.1 secreted Zn-dependent insulinase-like peptidase [Marinobacter persicus]PPK58622.1 secreted Zn-dependent insulinase-like peptidase [Marinobacter persicus]
MTFDYVSTSVTRHRPGIILFLLATLMLSQTAIASVTPTKSPNDNNDYRYLELDNQLQVMLVSDPKADMAAASMNVAVGSGDDPDDRAGLAHFLEHMLFLGTEKYPDAGEYQQFIRSHGGSHNAFTAFQDTNYFFDVEAQFLEPALDRFAQQFSAPLFTPELVDRERNAVHSEFSAKLKDDGRRLLSVRKASGNPDHAFSRFAVGNLTTLENTEDNPLRPDLVEFWREHYSANLMTLAVYGPQSLDELEAMVRKRFAAIENRNLTAQKHPEPILDMDRLPEKVTAETLKDSRHLTLAFPIPSQKENYKTKPASYLANLIGHEGPGSLFDVLKTAGLVESLSAGLGMDTGQNATLEISMALTRKGLANQDTIINLTFEYLDQIRQNGISEERFHEMQQLARIDFRFRERGKPVREAMRLSRSLRDYPVEDVLSAPWLMENYAPEQYRALLQQLTPDNLQVRVSSPDPKLENPKRTQWYNTPWQREPLQLRSKAETNLTSQLSLPEANPFVPENLELVGGDTMAHPERLADFQGLDVWYARDTQFNTPKANVFISLRTPATQDSARTKVLTQLLMDTVNTNLNAQAYPAQLAGLSYRVYSHLRGITVRIGGYDDKLHTLLQRILAELADPTITPQRFEIDRQRLIDSLENQAKNRPVQQTSEFVQTALIEGTFPTSEKLAAAREVTLEELRAFAGTLLASTDPVMLAHGNLTRAAALNMARQVQALVLDEGQRTSVPRSSLRQLPPGETHATIKVDHPDTGYTLYLQGRDTSYPERARFRLLAQIVGSPFYEEIRTSRQLGYIVYGTNFEILETPALGLIVQSPEASGATIDAAVTEFAQDFTQQLKSLDDNRLNREKQAVISRLLESDRQLDEISSRYWREIDRQNYDFDSREQLAEAVRQVSLEELNRTYENALLDRQRALRVTTGQKGINEEEILEQLRQRPPMASTSARNN